jgi:hypothetical protein
MWEDDDVSLARAIARLYNQPLALSQTSADTARLARTNALTTAPLERADAAAARQEEQRGAAAGAAGLSAGSAGSGGSVGAWDEMPVLAVEEGRKVLLLNAFPGI